MATPVDATPTFAYPVNLNVRDRLCVVVGGGTVAKRKVAGLTAAGARVRVVAPWVEVRGAHEVEVVMREARDEDVAGAFLVICATDRVEVNRRMAAAARAAGALVEVVDAPELGDFANVSVVRRGLLQLTVSTGGLAPAVSRHVRRRLEEVFGPEWAAYARLLGEVRDTLRARFPHPAAREAAWERLLAAPLLELLRAGDQAGVEEAVAQCLDPSEEALP